MALVTRTIGPSANLATEIVNCGAGTDVLYLTAGTYTTGLTNSVDSVTRTRHLTIMPAPGVATSAVIIQPPGGGFPGEWKFDQVDYLRLLNLTIQPIAATSLTPALCALHLIGVKHFVVFGCTIIAAKNTAGCLLMDPNSFNGDNRRGGHDIWIVNNTFSSGDQSSVVNYCERAWTLGGDGASAGHYDDVYVRNNVWHHFKGDSGTINDITRCIVEDNTAHDIDYDGSVHPAGIRTGSPCRDIQIRRNFLYAVNADQFFFKDGLVERLVVENNVTDVPANTAFQSCNVHDFRNGAFVNNSFGNTFFFSKDVITSQDAVIFNNICASLDATSATAVPEITYKNYNLFPASGNPINFTPRASHEAAGIVSYVNAAANPPDLHLASSDTQAANTGVASSGASYSAPSTDRDGNVRPYGVSVDRGAYERQT